MGSKEIKKLLVEARDAVKNKDFVTALRNCKAVLDVDSNNYNAYIFLGAVYQETNENEKCLRAFKKAIDLSPSQITAWQGLRSFYEKDSKESGSDNSVELTKVYEKLLDFYGQDAVKRVNVLHSMAMICYETNRDLRKAVELILEGVELLEKGSLETVRLLSVLTDWLLSEAPHLDEWHSDILIDGVNKLCNAKRKGPSGDAIVASNFADRYLNHLLAMHKYDFLIHEAEKLVECGFQSVNVTFWRFRIYVSSTLDGIPVEESLVLDSFTDLPDHMSSNKLTLEFRYYCQIAKGTHNYLNGKLVEAKNDFVTALNVQRGKGWEGWLLFCRLLEKLRDGVTLEHSAVEGLKVTETESCDGMFRTEFKLLHAVGILFQGEQHRLESALDILKEVAGIEAFNSKALFHEGVIHLKMKNWEKMRDVVTALKLGSDQLHLALALEGCLYSRRGDNDAAKQTFLHSLQISSNDAFVLLELGTVHWNLKDYSTAYGYFLQAAKIDPYNATTFLTLGHYYRDVTVDMKRAQRCYKVAYDLNKRDDEIGISLSDCYRSLGEEETNSNFLISVTSEAPIGSCAWAWLRLGVLHLHRDEPEKAISFLQAALRVDSSNRECWECLGEAYLLRGSHSSAVKAFNKALELEPNLLYCKYQIANIKLCLGFFKDAIESFKQIIEVVPSYVPALKGLGEAYLAQARSFLENAIHGSAFDCCESALIPLTRAVVQRPNFLCVWKLLGDACTLISNYTPGVRMRVPAALTKSPSTTDGDYTDLDAKGVLALGVRCYITCTRLSDTNANLWHDVGVSHYRLALVSDKKDRLIENAVGALKKAIALSPRECSHWCALGVVACISELKNYALAQHCFIQAVKVEPNKVAAWTNLGTLYLLHDNVKLANKAFVVAQSIDPTFVNCWIGQALCAESIGHHDTLDLFRHCTNLGYHPEGSIGYASWVCSTLLDAEVDRRTEFYRYNIVELTAIEAATDSASHYTGSIMDDPCAFNTLGLLLERQSMFIGSERAFRKAQELLAVSISAAVSDEDSSKSKLLSFVQCNLARVLRCTDQFEESYSVAAVVKTLDLYNVHCRALALYQAHMMEESAKEFDIALNLARTETERSHLRMSMASIVYKLQGSFEAKTLLFECFQSKQPCVQALLALASIGLLESDSDLTGATMQELEASGFVDSSCAPQIHYLRSITFELLDCGLTARNVFCKVLHKRPDDWVYWKRLSVHMMKCRDRQTAFTCLSSSLKTCSAPSMEVLQLFSICLILTGLEVQGLSAGKKLVHQYPDEKRNWEILNFVRTSK